MYNRPRIRVVQLAVNRAILKPIGIALPEVQHAITARNPTIGPLFATLLRKTKVAALRRDPIGLLKQNLIKPSGLFLWARLFQVLVMGKSQLIPNRLRIQFRISSGRIAQSRKQVGHLIQFV